MILVSSDYAFPVRLRRQGVSFNTLNLNGIIYAGEVAPKDMYTLLTERWGLPTKLALQLMNNYGGHIYNTYQALTRLHKCHLNGKPFVAFDSDLSARVVTCLNLSLKTKMPQVLQALATTGFCGIDDSENELVKIITECNVGGVVRSDCAVIGLNPDLWKSTGCCFGIVPTSQTMRLIILKVLHRRNLLVNEVE